jgi:hypothetical protein
MDAILFWNSITQEINRRDFTHDGLGSSTDQGALMVEQGGPTRTSRGFAMVHIAMYEAVARCQPGSLAGYPPLAGVAAPAGLPAAGPARDAFTAGAVSGAAATVLLWLWKRQLGFVQDGVNGAPHSGTPEFENGRTWGNGLGEAMIALRVMDGSEVPDFPIYSSADGHHRPDPYAPMQGRLGTRWGDMTPFCIAAAAPGTIHATYLDPHPALGTARYDQAVDDVRKEGAVVTSSRKPWETVAGIYWGYDGARGLGVPPRLYNQVVRAFAETHMAANTIVQNARLYALINAGMADAAIVAWSAKYHYDLWRPVIGIREHDSGFGPANGSGTGPTSVFCDPGWAPLGRPGTNTPGDFTKTPDFPAYPSGHATFGAVAFKLAAKFYAEQYGKTFEVAFKETKFDFISDEYNGVNQDPHGDARPRHSRTLTLGYAVAENALSRVWIGVHWRFDGMGAKLPDDLKGITMPRKIPNDPATPDPALDEAKLGGVPAGLKIADEVFAGHFQ